MAPFEARKLAPQGADPKALAPQGAVTVVTLEPQGAVLSRKVGVRAGVVGGAQRLGEHAAAAV
ncbi:MAG TPA: hypothetical protein VIQ78_02440, partial [Terrimesophilobacter sp.]|uniref:hypothetical protein n=1 Tax=Terrimesophilobacter sp. TaxID=2906435 RepID=UPI002F91FC5D